MGASLGGQKRNPARPTRPAERYLVNSAPPVTPFAKTGTLFEVAAFHRPTPRFA